MSERRTKFRGHPDGQKLFHLADAIAKAENPQRWFDGVQEAENTNLHNQPEWRADKQRLKDEMEKELEGGIFRDFINGRNNR